MDPGVWVGAAVFLPLVMAAATPLAEKLFFRGRIETFITGVSAATGVLAALAALAVMGGRPAAIGIGGDLGIGEILFFSVDYLGLFVGIIAVGLWTLASLHSTEYMEHEHSRARYGAFSLLAFSGMLGAVFAGNLITLLFFFELLTFSSYMLVVHEQNKEAWQAGLLYIFLGIGAGLALLFAIIAVVVSMDGGDITGIGVGLGGNRLEFWIFWCFVLGFGIKAGLFPVHIWLPKAHPVAPSPASALLSGIIIKAGAYGIIRMVFVFWGSPELVGPMLGSVQALLVLAMIGIFLGSAVAMAQSDIKSLLAYSSISQIGYVILGVALMTPRGLTGGIIQIFNHALIKGCLFLCAGNFIHKTGKRKVSDLVGIGRELPVTTFCFTVAALSMIGIPPLNGFVSKWMLALGSLDAAEAGLHAPWWGYLALGVLLLSSLMNLIYYGPILYGAWFGAAEEGHHGGHGESKEPAPAVVEPTWRMLAPVILLAAGVVFFGVFPRWPLKAATAIARKLMAGF